VATKHFPKLLTHQAYHIERGETIYCAVLLDTTIKFDWLVYIIWDRMHALEDIQYAA